MAQEQKNSLYPLIIIEPSEAGQRLDHILATRFGLVPRKFRRLVTQGRVRINGRALLEGAPRQEPGTAVEILAGSVEPALLAEDIPLPSDLKQAITRAGLSHPHQVFCPSKPKSV